MLFWGLVAIAFDEVELVIAGVIITCGENYSNSEGFGDRNGTDGSYTV